VARPGSRRTTRFDRYPFAGCAPGFGQLDISSVVLPKQSDAYRSDPFPSLSADLRAVGFTDATKKYLV
jgi:hypothetical protein